MAEVTQADRDLASRLLDLAPMGGTNRLLEAVAAALAEERERARAPFLALADEFDTEADVQNMLGAGNWKITYLIDAAERIRRAAEEA